MTDENKPLNYRTLSELYAAYNSGVAFEVTDSEGTYPETYPVTGMSLTEDAAGLYVFAKTSTFPHVPWSVFLPDGSLEDHSFLHLRHSPEPTQPADQPAPVAWRYHCEGDPVKWHFSDTPSLLGLTQPLYASAQPAVQALDAQRLTKASRYISTVLRVEGVDLEIGSRRLLREARDAIDAAIAAQQGAKP